MKKPTLLNYLQNTQSLEVMSWIQICWYTNLNNGRIDADCAYSECSVENSECFIKNNNDFKRSRRDTDDTNDDADYISYDRVVKNYCVDFDPSEEIKYW